VILITSHATQSLWDLIWQYKLIRTKLLTILLLLSSTCKKTNYNQVRFLWDKSYKPITKSLSLNVYLKTHQWMCQLTIKDWWTQNYPIVNDLKTNYARKPSKPKPANNDPKFNKSTKIRTNKIITYKKSTPTMMLTILHG
jgi:hypothetical protein